MSLEDDVFHGVELDVSLGEEDGGDGAFELAASAATAGAGGAGRAAGFERMPRGAPSNMTCSLTRRRGGRSHTVLWNITRTPAALRPAWQEIEAVTR